jgi:hypothetical protein
MPIPTCKSDLQSARKFFVPTPPRNATFHHQDLTITARLCEIMQVIGAMRLAVRSAAPGHLIYSGQPVRMHGILIFRM